MTERDFRRPDYLLGGRADPRPDPQPSRFLQANDPHMPYTDRKLLRFDEDAPLDIQTIVAIQTMACEGKRIDEIYREIAKRGLGATLEQISRVLNPDPDGGPRRRPERANVGYAKLKGRR